MNEAERLAALEAQIGSFDAQLHEIKSALLRMDTKLDAWQSTYVPRAEINEMFRSRDEKIAYALAEVADLYEDKKAAKSLIPAWVQTAAAIAAIILSIYSMKN